MQIQQGKIISHQLLADKVYEMRIQIEYKHVLPGQFVHIRVDKQNRFMLRRPISIAKIHDDGISIIYRVNGEGTSVLSTYKVNDFIDVLGPLGNGYDLKKMKGKIALFGGGIGVPPMYELALQLVKLGYEIVVVLGFQSKKDVFLKQAFEKIAPTYITTIDGSVGKKGFLNSVLLEEEFDMYCACGPMKMLQALETTYPNKKGFISIENRMACGIGACYACVCNTKEDYTRVCIEGPVYSVGEVILCD